MLNATATINAILTIVLCKFCREKGLTIKIFRDASYALLYCEVCWTGLSHLVTSYASNMSCDAVPFFIPHLLEASYEDNLFSFTKDIALLGIS